MKRVRLKGLSVDQLVDCFADIGIAQDEALLYDEHAKFRHLYSQMEEVDKELRARGTEARRALARLFDHPNMQVKLQAAKWSLGVLPKDARRVIESKSMRQTTLFVYLPRSTAGVGR